MARARSAASTTGPASRRGRSSNSSGASVTHADLVKEAKKGIGHSEAARNLGVTVGQISSMQWSQALVAAGRFETAPATKASVRKLKDVEGNRWELIAARIGETVSRAKELYGSEEEVAAAARRGRKSSDEGGSSTPSKKARGGRKTASAPAAGPRRARTRAERQKARSGNPS